MTGVPPRCLHLFAEQLRACHIDLGDEGSGISAGGGNHDCPNQHIPPAYAAAATALATHSGGQELACKAGGTRQQRYQQQQEQPPAPIVLNMSHQAPLRRRQHLYEALLPLEAQGCAIIERQLPGPEDIVLSPAAAMCLWDEERSTARSSAALPLPLQLQQCVTRLSMAYEQALLLLLLPAELLDAAARAAPELTQLAAAMGVRLSMLLCHTEAQAMVWGLSQALLPKPCH